MENPDKSKQQLTEPTQEGNKGGDKSVASTFIDSTTLISRSYVYDFASEAYCRDHGRSRKDVVGNSVAHVGGKQISENSSRNIWTNVLPATWCVTKMAGISRTGAKIYRVFYSPYFNVDGQVTHAVVASLDITDLKREEELLEKSEPGFRTILKGMQYGVFTFDTEGRFTFVNDVVAKRAGYPREWFVGKSLFDLVRPQERETVRGHFRASVRGERVPPYEFAYRRAADDIAWVHISTTALREGGRIVGVLGVLRDITKRIQTQQALKESEEKYRTLFEDPRMPYSSPTEKEGSPM